MKANIDKLELGCYYHIYNRGVNGEILFSKSDLYDVFLKKYDFHISPIADTFAYCLMNNHFHLLIKVKPTEEIKSLLETKYSGKKVECLSTFVSKQFAHLFNGFAQVVNNRLNRTGPLFEKPFRRIKVDSDAYFSQLITYIHQNPEKHKFTDDFRDYSHSSYQSLLLNKPTKLKREEVIEWFGNKSDFEKIHQEQRSISRLEKYTIEFD